MSKWLAARRKDCFVAKRKNERKNENRRRHRRCFRTTQCRWWQWLERRIRKLHTYRLCYCLVVSRSAFRISSGDECKDGIVSMQSSVLVFVTISIAVVILPLYFGRFISLFSTFPFVRWNHRLSSRIFTSQRFHTYCNKCTIFICTNTFTYTQSSAIHIYRFAIKVSTKAWKRIRIFSIELIIRWQHKRSTITNFNRYFIWQYFPFVFLFFHICFWSLFLFCNFRRKTPPWLRFYVNLFHSLFVNKSA